MENVYVVKSGSSEFRGALVGIATTIEIAYELVTSYTEVDESETDRLLLVNDLMASDQYSPIELDEVIDYYSDYNGQDYEPLTFISDETRIDAYIDIVAVNKQLVD